METATTLDFGDSRYRFWLPMARIVEIERICDKSILQMHADFGASLRVDQLTEATVFVGGGAGRIRDVYEVIRCAAIGGGERHDGDQTAKVSAIDAKRLVDAYVDGRPLAETLPVAWAILQTAIHGIRLDAKKNGPADEGDLSLSEREPS